MPDCGELAIIIPPELDQLRILLKSMLVPHSDQRPLLKDVISKFEVIVGEMLVAEES